MTELLPWALGLFVVLVAAATIWFTFGKKTPESSENDYLRALESWLEGDLEEAEQLLRQVVQDNPDSVDPFLQLGNLLCLRGDAATAAVLHRGLTVRQNLPKDKKVMIGLALAGDLVALKRWPEAADVLDTILQHATGTSAYWKTLFAQRHGSGDQPEAARALKSAIRLCPAKDEAWFENAYVSYQLDRALEHCYQAEFGEARARIKDVEKIESAGKRPALVRAILATAEKNTSEAVKIASTSLLDSPAELEVFLPSLKNALLESGQYTRTVPILERACQEDNAPATLWISLALLYEKLDQRDKAIQLLESKAQSPDFTPNIARPYLRLLAAEHPDTAFATVWNFLGEPESSGDYICAKCDFQTPGIRWFCPECQSFDSFSKHRINPEVK